VFLVSVRFAYGFLDFLFTYNLHQLCPFAPFPLFEGISSLLRAAAPQICRPFPACADGGATPAAQTKVRASVCGSLVPYAL